MKVTLINTTKRIKVFNLPHDTYCKPTGVCMCRIFGYKGKPLPASLTIPSGEKMEHLPDAILKIPEVARAIRRGEVKVRREREPKKVIKKPKRKPGPRPRKKDGKKEDTETSPFKELE